MAKSEQHPWAMASTAWPELKRLPFGINLHRRPGTPWFKFGRRPRPVKNIILSYHSGVSVHCSEGVDLFSGCTEYKFYRTEDDGTPEIVLRLAKSTQKKMRRSFDGVYCGVAYYTLYKTDTHQVEVRSSFATSLFFMVDVFVTAVQTTWEGSQYLGCQYHSLISINEKVFN